MTRAVQHEQARGIEAAAPPTSFVHTTSAMRVTFSPGELELVRTETARLGCKRVLVLCTPGQAALGRVIANQLGDFCQGVHARARMHVPVDEIVGAVAAAQEARADACSAVGGGSAIGLGKALARRLDLPLIAIPTTYSGSEMTSVWGETDRDGKRTGRDDRVLPRSVLYFAELTRGLPTEASIASGFNAIAHAVEALYAPNTNPLVCLMAEEAIRAFATALPRIARQPDDTDARTMALYAAWLCGICLQSTSMGLHHKICHVLGGLFDLPHAQTHAALISHVLHFNMPAAHLAANRIGRVLETTEPARRLHELLTELGGNPALAAFGFRESDIASAVVAITAGAYPNPRPVDADAVRQILIRALSGAPPTNVEGRIA